MYASNLRVLILDQEFDRICEYVSNVPHRGTGGLLIGTRFIRGGVDYMIILEASMGVPDIRVGDENCVDHPLVGAEDFAPSRPGGTPGVRVLGRWHAHLDGLNRPSANDLDWAISILEDPSCDVEELLHPIVIPSIYEVRVYPYLASRSSMTFQKINWQVTTQAEIDDLRANRPAAGGAGDAKAGTQLFSLLKTRDKFRKEANAVQSIHGVSRAEVTDDGSRAILHVEMRRGDDDVQCWITGDSLYPVHAPSVRVEVNGGQINYRSGLLSAWNSMHQLSDILKDLNQYLSRLDTEEALPPPDIHESDPIKREAAILQAAGYTVNTTEATKAGVLLVVRSPVLTHADKTFYAILPLSYPNGSPAWALADAHLPLDEVEFEQLPEIGEGFTLLTFLEKLYPAARAQRAEAHRTKTKTSSAWAGLVHLFLFVVALLSGYLWEVTGEKHPRVIWRMIAAGVKGQAVGLSTAPSPRPSTSPNGSPSPTVLALSPKAPLLVIYVDAGQATDLTPRDAESIADTVLRPVPIHSLRVDLTNVAQDVAATQREAGRAQALLVITYRAGPRQAQLLQAARQAKKPIMILSVVTGDQEKAVQEGATLYAALNVQDMRKVRPALQQALMDWMSSGKVIVR